jgi:tetraacyldisaccharide 4'-kinase
MGAIYYFILTLSFIMIRSILTFLPSLLYQGITSLRNSLFDQGILATKRFDRPFLISVGNLSVGGTGKSPLVAYLIKHWPWKSEIGILSRGYGRKSKGFRWVDAQDLATEVGDEPLAYKKMYHKIPVAVCEKRSVGVQRMIDELPFLDTVLLDDAFQHRSIGRHINLLCTTYHHPFFQDHVLPMGRLRESRAGAKRADAVIVNRCPKQIDRRLFDHLDLPVFFTEVMYGEPIGHFTSQQWHAIAGIADPIPFFEHLRFSGEILSERIFPDHHAFTPHDIKDLENLAQNLPDHQGIITTHKDYVRLEQFFLIAPNLKQRLTYLTMEIRFVDGDKAFWSFLASLMKREIA